MEATDKDVNFCPWWEHEEYEDEDRARALFAHAKDLEIRHQEAHENNLLYAQLYSNRELPSFDWGYGVSVEPSLSPVSRLSENLALSVVDTFVARIGKMRPKPTVVLRGAPWKLRRAAKKLDRWLYASFLKHDIFTHGKLMFRDAAIFGFGAVRVDVDGDDLCVERLFPDDVLVDQRECLSGQPPLHLMVRKVMTFSECSTRFGIPIEEVSKRGEQKYLGYRGVGPNHVVVIEAWRRAMKTDAGKVIPGRRLLAMDGHIIDEEAWDECWFPVIFYKWQEPPNGWYCPSAVEQVFPYQLRLNEINEVIREAQDLMARPRILVPEGSRINVNQITNEIGKFIRYTGPQKPEAIQWTAVSGELYGERDRLVKSCYEFMGISQMSAQAVAPEQARFDSSAAFREFNEIEQTRFSDQAQRLEKMYLQIAETLVRVVKKYKVKAPAIFFRPGKRTRSEKIMWEDIDLDDQAYHITLQPSSSLNETPAARLDELHRMLAAGDITPAQFQQHFANPDLEHLMSLAGAAGEDIDAVIELLQDGEYEAPTEFQDLDGGTKKVHAAMLQTKREWDDVPQEVFDNFEQWILHAKAILDAQAAAMLPTAAQQAMPPGSSPISLANPMPPPLPAPVMDPMMGAAPPMPVGIA